MSILFVTANEATAAQRTVHFCLRLATDGITAATGKTGQPQISTNGAAFTDTGISTITEVGSGDYTAVLTQAAVLTAGDQIRVRFRDAGNTVVEARAEQVVVVAFDPYAATGLGLSNLDAAVSSRSATGAAMALTSGERTTMVNAIWDEANSSHVTAGTTGKNLSTAGTAADPWSTSLPGAYASGQAGNIIGNNLNATMTSRAVPGDAMTLTAGERTTIDAMGKTVPGAYGAGTAGSIIGNNLNTTVSSRAPEAGGNVAAIKAKTDNLPALPSATGDQMNLTVAEETTLTNKFWNEAIAGHLAAGSTGNKLNAAASAGDPWVTALPGAYVAGSAGKIVGDNLNATISSRTPESGGNVAAIKVKTDNLPAVPAASGDTMALAVSERTAIANAIFDLANAIDGLTLRQAQRLELAALVGKLSGAAGAAIAIRNVGDTKDRITATVDAFGNRSSVTIDAT